MTRTSHILIKLIEAWSPPNKNFSSSHHVYQKWLSPKQELLIFSSSQILKGEVMRTSHILIMWFEARSPQNENFSSSHHVYQIWQPLKQELLIFSSCLSKIASPQTRTSHLLMKSNLEGRDNENFSSSHQVNWSLKLNWHDEKMRSSCLGGFKLQLTWWEYEKFSSSLPLRLDFMRRWEVLV